MTSDELFMSRALELAQNGRGFVEPNPMVGALIVRDGAEISRGWHRRFGGPHAEIEALTAAREGGADVRGSTVYVTLEPCCHFGKTPPCTDALIRAGVAKVVAAMQDVDEKVAGGGFARLRQAGIEVISGVCEEQARKMLAAYIKLRTRRRPWVICKWAQTADGFISLPVGDKRRWISSEASRQKVHEIRSYCDGILAGIGTVLADDPLLTNRSGGGKQPTPVILDSKLRTPPSARVMQAHAGGGVIIATTQETVLNQDQQAKSLIYAGADLMPLPSRDGKIDLCSLLDELGRRGWTYLLVEGGAHVHKSFLDAGLADELLVFVSPERVGRPGHPTLRRLDIEELRRNLPLVDLEETILYGDRVFHARLKWE